MASLAAQGPPPSTKALAQFATEYDRSHRALQLQRGGAAGAGAGAPPTDPALERSAREHRRKEAEGIQKELGTLEYQAQELDVALQAVTKQNAEEQGRLRQTKARQSFAEHLSATKACVAQLRPGLLTRSVLRIP